MKKRFKLPLLAQIVIAMALGVGAGFLFPEWFSRIFVTFNAVFSQFLGFMIPLIIIGFITPAIAEVGAKAGKVLVVTALLAYADTVFAGFVSFFTGDWIFPSLVSVSDKSALGKTVELEPYFTVMMPPLCDVMSALVFSFIVGIGIAVVKKSGELGRIAETFRNIISLCIGKIIIPLLPIYIFGIFMNMTVGGHVGRVLGAFAKIIGVIFIMTALLLIFQYCVAACFNRRNPLKMLWTMMPAYFTALGTQSSAATIPVTLRQTLKLGVSEDIAGFTVPLCATIHMSGSTLKIVACAVALMLMQGMDYSVGQFATLIMMMGITIVAAPGVPGGAIMASLGLLASVLGFTEADQAMMIALYIAMDSFGTACNVTGDGYISVIVDRFWGNRKNPIPLADRP